VAELKQRIGEQSAAAKDAVAAAAKTAKLEAELKQIDAATAEVDAKIRDATLTTGASAAPTVKVVAPAKAPRRATRPDRDRTFLTGAALGLLGGLALAAVMPMRGRA
jgi:seryl-tRNA synthetase